MKSTRLVTNFVVASCVTAFGVAAVQAESNDVKERRARVVTAPPRQRVVLVTMTGSLIPQRVVLVGNNVNGASPLTVYGRNDLFRSGAGDLASSLAMIDPNITIRRR
jgi:hypothetical protein